MTCLSEVVTDQALKKTAVASKPKASDRLMRRYRLAVKQKHITGVFGVGSTSSTFVRQIKSNKAHQEPVYEELSRTRPENKASSINYERMELRNMPLGGWEIDNTKQSCPCRYAAKFGVCIHSIHASWMEDNLVRGQATGIEFVNRSVKKHTLKTKAKRRNANEERPRKAKRSNVSKGRPRKVGRALQYD